MATKTINFFFMIAFLISAHISLKLKLNSRQIMGNCTQDNNNGPGIAENFRNGNIIKDEIKYQMIHPEFQIINPYEIPDEVVDEKQNLLRSSN
jgi:hypothetical protein